MKKVSKYSKVSGQLFGRSIFDNPDTTRFNITEALFKLSETYDMSDDDNSFLLGLIRAIYGRSLYHRIQISMPKSGSKVMFAARIGRAHEALMMADEIDIAVANGSKLDAEICEAAAVLKISEREVFRRLSKIREQRKDWAKDIKKYGLSSVGRHYIPRGFGVDREGKLKIDKSKRSSS